MSIERSVKLMTRTMGWPLVRYSEDLKAKPFWCVTKSPSRASFHSPAIPKLLQVGSDSGVELHGFGLLLAQGRGKPLHLLLKRLAVVLGGLCADVSPRGEH